MEKLIELLNEYQEEKGSEIRFKRIDNSDFFVCWDDVWLGYETILSKKFWFIKWLVDNDKIDKEKVWKNESPDIFDYSFYEVVLMLLSIQDNPIEFLISILK
jgi:hypothetical protein